MTVVLASLKADLKREKEGAWIDYPDWPGVAFNVSSIQLPAYVTARDLLFQKLARKYKKKPIPKLVLSVELGRLYATHLLHGWRGLDVQYTPDTAMETLTAPEYRDVVIAVEYCAAQVSEINVKFLDEEGDDGEQGEEDDSDDGDEEGNSRQPSEIA